MKLKIITEVSERIDRILADREEELENLDELIKAEESTIATASRAMEAATAAGDLEAYRQAKSDRAAALDGKEMHEARKTALNEKPLITESEYRKAMADIRAEVAAADDQTKQKLTALSDQMNSAALDLRDTLNQANEVLSRLQHDLYRDADRTRNRKTGEIMLLDSETVQVKRDFFNTVSWGRAGVETYTYKAYTGQKG